MSFNVQIEGSQGFGYLLQWVNLEQAHQSNNGYFFSFAQVLEHDPISEILKNVDSVTFEDFGILNPSKKMDTIEKYLDRQFGKRLKWGFKQSLGDFKQQTHIKQLAKLSCYFSIHSKKKNEFINRILTLSQESQTFLMQQMQKIQTKMENITQIKQIIEQIQFLEYENEQLNSKLQQMTKVNDQIYHLLKQSQDENKTLKIEIEKFRKQKFQVFASLKIDYICQYLQAYKKLQHQNQRYLDLLSQAQCKIQTEQKNIHNLNDRIKDDYNVINHLNDQIIRLKQICNEKYDGDWLNITSSSKFHLLKSAGSNKENINSECRTSLGKSMDVPTQWLGQSIQDSNCDKNPMRTHNQQLMSKLQGMYSKYNELNNQASGLRSLNKKLTKSNTNLRQIMKQVQYTYKQFQFKYRAADNEGKLLIKKATSIKTQNAQL